MDFTQSLKAQVEKALGQKSVWGDVNPLVIIGLTEAILDLGLSEDQIYSVVHSYGRQLAAQVHPDRPQPNVSSERQGQILSAFDVLNDRDNFAKALAEFRTIKAEDRREVRLLVQTLAALRHQIAGYETQFERVEIGRKKLDHDYQFYLKLKREEPARTPILEEEVAQLKAELEAEKFLAKDLQRNESFYKHRATKAEDKIVTLEKQLSELIVGLPALRGEIILLHNAFRWVKGVHRENLEKEKAVINKQVELRWQEKYESSRTTIARLSDLVRILRAKLRIAKISEKKAREDLRKAKK